MPALQEAAERAIAAGVRRVDRTGDPPLEAALVALDPQTGNILAMVGGSNYRRSTFNRATALAPSGRIRVQAVRVYRGVVERVQSRDACTRISTA